MHQAGFVHRDIKPSNIMLLPRENRWTVIDFGSAAQIGMVVPLSYTLMYAPPEIAAAVSAGAHSTVVDPAVDSWALGVVAFELLSGSSTFDVLHDGKRVVRFRPPRFRPPRFRIVTHAVTQSPAAGSDPHQAREQT